MATPEQERHGHRRLGVALVGCGAIGQVHAAVATGTGEIDVVAVVDAAPQATERLAASLERAGRVRPRQFTSLDEALELDAVELVVLAVPSGLHVELAVLALQAGRHVLVEKPLDVDLARARTAAQAAARAADDGLVASVVSQHRFDDASTVVAEAVSCGALGRISSAVASTAWWRGQEYYDSAAWRGTWALDGGGALVNQGIHNLDLLLSLLGRAVTVSGQMALLAHEGIEVEDVATATVIFESGALAVLHATTAAYPGHSTRLHVMGSRGSAVIEDDRLTYLHCAERATGPDATVGPMGLQAPRGDQSGAAVAATVPEPVRLGADLPAAAPGQYFLDPSSHARQYLDVITAIRDGKRPRVAVQDAFETLAVARAVYVSAALGRPVDVEDVASGRYDHVAVRLPGH